MCIRKCIILSFLFVVFTVVFGNSQWCKTTHHPNLNSLTSNPSGQSTSGSFALRVYFHVINDSNGNGGQSEFEVEESFRLINEAYNLHNINFVWDCEIIEHNDDDLFSINDVTNNAGWMLNDDHDDGIDIYLFPDNKAFNGSAFFIGQGTKCFVSGIEPESGIPLTPSHAISHEIGHILNLYHTHHECGTEVEPANGESWSSYGDFIEDTPPDPGIGRNIDECPGNSTGQPNCNWTGVQDENCDTLSQAELNQYDPSTVNYMAYTLLCCMREFSSDQVSVMRSHIANSAHLQAIIIPDVFKVEGNVTINTPTAMHSNILVKQGGFLSINSELNMLEGKRIFVESGAALRLGSGSRIYSACGQWGGIYLQGGTGQQVPSNQYSLGSESPAIFVANNATIENAVTLLKQHASNQNGQSYWGGIIEATDVTFQNCDRGVEMMRFDGDDLSYFRGCTFNTERYGMSLWRNNQVEISNCEFNNSDYGILTVNSSVQVSDNCRFNGCNEYGIRLQGTHPNGLDIPSNIKDSYFSNDGTDIKMTGVTSSQRAEITNNNFIGTPAAATWMDGDNYYDITNNTFDGSAFTNIVYSTGLLPNRHDNNLISSNAYGILAMYTNPGYQFERNCFESSRNADVFVYGGEISSQGTQILANGNCFTESSATKDIDTNLNTSFVYFHTDPGEVPTPDCEIPLNDANYTTDISDASQGNDGCGSSIQPPSPPQVELCKPKKDIDSVKAAIKEIKPIVRELRSLVQVEKDKPEIIKAELDEKEQCLRKLILLLSSLLEDKDIDEAIRVLQQEPEFRYHIMAYGLMIRTGRLSEAQSYLRAMRPSTEEEQDFVYVQHIVIRDIIQGRKGFLNDTESSRTYDIAQKNDPLAAYARSLWYWYTEEDIELALPRIKGEEFVKPRSNVEQENTSWNIYPNPTRGTIHIAVDNLQIETQTVNRVSIIDITGRLQYEEEIDLSDVQHLDIDLSSGVYLLTISSGEAMLHSQRLVISN